jgi:regulatory protein
MEGRITSIQRQKKNAKRASIFIDEEFAFGVNDQTIEEFRLRKGDYLDRELYDKIVNFDLWIDAKRTALHYINYRARSEREIRDRLKKDDIPEAIVGRVLEFLSHYDLVNDEKWARAFINDKLGRKQVSASQIAFELRRKGVGSEVVEQAVAELNATETDEARAYRAAEKRWPRIEQSETDPRKRLQKLLSFLAGRGFSYAVAKAVAKKFVEGAEIMDDFEH